MLVFGVEVRCIRIYSTGKHPYIGFKNLPTSSESPAQSSPLVFQGLLVLALPFETFFGHCQLSELNSIFCTRTPLRNFFVCQLMKAMARGSNKFIGPPQQGLTLSCGDTVLLLCST